MATKTNPSAQNLQPTPQEPSKEQMDAALQDAVSIHPYNLDGDLISLPAHYAYWAEKFAQALDACGVAEVNTEHTEARVFLIKKSSLSLAHESGRGPAVGLVERETANDPQVIAAKLDLAHKQAVKARLYHLLKAFDHKAQMLITLAANRRKEYDNAGGITLNHTKPTPKYDGPVADLTDYNPRDDEANKTHYRMDP